MNKYIELFKEVCQSSELLAEKVMELDTQNKDDAGYKVAEQMRGDYAQLGDKIGAESFKIEDLSKQDYLKLLAGSYMITNNLIDKVASLKKAIEYYKTFFQPKLERIINEGEEVEDFKSIVAEVFKDGEEV